MSKQLRNITTMMTAVTLILALAACSGGPGATYAPGQTGGPGAYGQAPYPHPQSPQMPYPNGAPQYPPQAGGQPYGVGGGFGAAGGGGGGGAGGPGGPGGGFMGAAPTGAGPATLGAPPPMDPVDEAMMFEALHTSEQHLEPGSLYSMSVREAEVKDVFLALGRQSPFNFVIAPDVVGPVTVDMKDVPLQNLMDSIVSPLGLTYRIDGDVIWVERINTSTEFFTLNYIITRRTSTRTVTGNTIGGSGNFDSNVSNNGVDTISSTERTAIFENIRRSVQMLMSTDGKVELTEESGMISVVDYKANLVRIEDFLSRVTESLNRQVMITAKLVEVTYDKTNQFGIDWTAVAGDFSMSIASRTADEILNMAIDSRSVDTVVRAIAEKNNVSIRNSPNVSSLNNQAAIIVLGEQQVFFETIEDLDEATGQVIRRRTTPRSVTVGVTLHVVPQINSKGMIVLNVHNRVTEKVGEAIGPDGSVVPELSVREIDTIARLRQGQTMVLAGLTAEKDVKATSGVPILSDIPLIGDLVTSKRNEKRKTELVLFLTPVIVNP